MDSQIDPHAPPKVEHQHSGFIVSVRVKPLDSEEDSAVTPHSPGHIALAKGCGESKIFSYDFVHWSTGEAALDGNSFAPQRRVYDDVGAPLVENARNGFNCTLFAFGQTGSGKTHTMIGESGDDQGLIPRICRDLLLEASTTIDHVVSCKYEVSYVEIYMEKVKDLLDAKPEQAGGSSSLRVREHPETGPFVEGCRVETIVDYDGISRLMALGGKRRKTASTEMNEHSSRSHAIFVLTLTQDRVLPDGKKYVVVSKINLVDLAGSENARLAGSTGEQLKEGAAINKSLLTLGRVIKALAASANQRAGLARRRSSLQPDVSTPEKERSVSPSPGGSTRRSLDTGGPESGSKGKGSRRSSLSGPLTGGRQLSRGQSLGGIGSSSSSAGAPLAPPYRDSVLTYLLRDSLGGNSKTTLVATIRPGVSFQEETGVTLTYASQARTIVNVVHVNENPFVAAIKTLQKQVDELKKNLEIANNIIAASATPAKESYRLSPTRESFGSVQLASWMEEEDDHDGRSKLWSRSSEDVPPDECPSGPTSPGLKDIPEGEEDSANLLSEGVSALNNEDIDIVVENGSPVSGAALEPVPEDCFEKKHSTDSDSGSEADIETFLATMERADCSDAALPTTSHSSPTAESGPDEASQEVGGSDDVHTPLRSPLVDANGTQTWASVSSVSGEDKHPSPYSPLVPANFARNRPPDSATLAELEAAQAKCGFLLKRGFINTAYKLRYFKVEHNCMVFYKKSSDETRRGTIYCGGATVDKRRGDALDPRTPYAFALCTPQDPHHKVWTLQATSERERDDWILVINVIAALPSFGGAQSPGALIRAGGRSSTMAAVGKATCCVS